MSWRDEEKGGGREGDREGKGRDLIAAAKVHSMQHCVLLSTIFLIREKLILLFLLSDEDPVSSELEICFSMRC